MYDNKGCQLSVTSTRSSRLHFEWLDSRCFLNNVGGLERVKISVAENCCEILHRCDVTLLHFVTTAPSVSTKWSILPFFFSYSFLCFFLSARDQNKEAKKKSAIRSSVFSHSAAYGEPSLKHLFIKKFEIEINFTPTTFFPHLHLSFNNTNVFLLLYLLLHVMPLWLRSAYVSFSFWSFLISTLFTYAMAYFCGV